MKLNVNVAELKYSLIRMLNEESRKYSNSIDLTIGEPDLEADRGIVEDAAEYALNNKLGYPPTGGGPEIRNLVADYYNRRTGSNFVADNVIMNVGASEAISSCFRALLNVDDEVIVFSPFYAGYPPMINMCYAKPVFVDITKTDFKVTKELLEEYMTEKTKIVLFCNPCNPTGNVMSYDEIKEVTDYLADKDVFILADEIYSELYFEDFTSFASFDKIKDKLILINGFSKSHSMTGWRIGYTIFPLEYRSALLNTTLFTLSSPMAVSLAAAKSALTRFEDRSAVRKVYKERAVFMDEKLSELGFKVVKPKGAFYLFANYSDISDLNSFDFAMDVLKEVQVALVPGISFGTENYFRISLIHDIPVLEEAVARLKKYIEIKGK